MKCKLGELILDGVENAHLQGKWYIKQFSKQCMLALSTVDREISNLVEIILIEWDLC
jgi:hypothetical protein